LHSSKPTILYILDTLQTGGAEKSLLAITSRLEHFTPVFVTLFAGKHDLARDYEAAGIRVIRLGLPVSNRFKEIAKLVDKIVEREQAVIVHSSIFRSDMVARLIRSKVKIVNSLVNNSYRKRRYDGLNLKGKLALLAVQLWDRWTVGKIDLMIANSQVLVNSHRRTIGLDVNKAVVIHRGREVPVGSSHLKVVSFDNLEILNQRSKIQNRTWLCVGRLIERKGHRDLIPAFANLMKSRPQDRLILAGDGPYRREIEELIDRWGVKDSVVLLGTVDNVAARLEEADFFVFPTYFEGLPGSLIEAMLSRTPIICSDIPENRECIKDEMCLFHRVGDQMDLLTKMKEAVVLDDWDIRTQKAYDYAVEHFEIGKIVKQYEETYLQLLSN
jgi:glycosyltransferase involved in cell wall biosynthesis